MAVGRMEIPHALLSAFYTLHWSGEDESPGALWVQGFAKDVKALSHFGHIKRAVHAGSTHIVMRTFNFNQLAFSHKNKWLSD